MKMLKYNILTRFIKIQTNLDIIYYAIDTEGENRKKGTKIKNIYIYNCHIRSYQL